VNEAEKRNHSSWCDGGDGLLTPTSRCVLGIVKRMMLSLLEISDIAAESDDGVHRIRRRGRARHDLVSSAVVGAAESHVAFPPHATLDTVCRKPSRTSEKDGGMVHVGENSLRVRWSEDGVCVSARLYEASLGRNGGLLRLDALHWPVVLNVCGLHDTALVSAYYTRSLRAFACPLGSGTDARGATPRQRRSDVSRGVKASTEFTCGRTTLHVSKVAQMSEWRAAKSRTLASMRPTRASHGALWQMCCGMGGGGIHVPPCTARRSFSLLR
jgi:hypothetical protein